MINNNSIYQTLFVYLFTRTINFDHAESYGCAANSDARNVNTFFKQHYRLMEHAK